MNISLNFKNRSIITLSITAFVWILLLWDYTHGGVPSHHLLNNKELPKVSNWIGGFLLPVLSWILLYSSSNRIKEHMTPRPIYNHFLIALGLGISIAFLFTFDIPDIPGYLLLSLLPLSLFYPIHHSEGILGFIIGMTYTFGTVIPTLVAFLFAILGFGIYHYLRAFILWIIAKTNN
jgi:hypothetical protein